MVKNIFILKDMLKSEKFAEISILCLMSDIISTYQFQKNLMSN